MQHPTSLHKQVGGYMRSDNLQLNCVQPPTSIDGQDGYHGCHDHYGHHGHHGHQGHHSYDDRQVHDGHYG